LGAGYFLLFNFNNPGHTMVDGFIRQFLDFDKHLFTGPGRKNIAPPVKHAFYDISNLVFCFSLTINNLRISGSHQAMMINF